MKSLIVLQDEDLKSFFLKEIGNHQARISQMILSEVVGEPSQAQTEEALCFFKDSGKAHFVRVVSITQERYCSEMSHLYDRMYVIRRGDTSYDFWIAKGEKGGGRKIISSNPVLTFLSFF